VAIRSDRLLLSSEYLPHPVLKKIPSKTNALMMFRTIDKRVLFIIFEAAVEKKLQHTCLIQVINILLFWNRKGQTHREVGAQSHGSVPLMCTDWQIARPPNFFVRRFLFRQGGDSASKSKYWQLYINRKSNQRRLTCVNESYMPPLRCFLEFQL
jgi:hypothetical protein